VTVAIGELSYAMYLWHIPVLAIIVSHFHAGLAVQSLVYWPSVMAIAWLSQRFVERRFRAPRREPQRAATEVPVIPAQAAPASAERVPVE